MRVVGAEAAPAEGRVGLLLAKALKLRRHPSRPRAASAAPASRHMLHLSAPPSSLRPGMAGVGGLTFFFNPEDKLKKCDMAVFIK